MSNSNDKSDDVISLTSDDDGLSEPPHKRRRTVHLKGISKEDEHAINKFLARRHKNASHNALIRDKVANDPKLQHLVSDEQQIKDEYPTVDTTPILRYGEYHDSVDIESKTDDEETGVDPNTNKEKSVSHSPKRVTPKPDFDVSPKHKPMSPLTLPPSKSNSNAKKDRAIHVNVRTTGSKPNRRVVIPKASPRTQRRLRDAPIARDATVNVLNRQVHSLNKEKRELLEEKRELEEKVARLERAQFSRNRFSFSNSQRSQRLKNDIEKALPEVGPKIDKLIKLERPPTVDELDDVLTTGDFVGLPIATPEITREKRHIHFKNILFHCYNNRARLTDLVKVCIFLCLFLCVIVYITLVLCSFSLNKLLEMVNHILCGTQKMNNHHNLQNVQNIQNLQNDHQNLQNDRQNISFHTNNELRNFEVENSNSEFNLFMNIATQFEPIFNFSNFDLNNNVLFIVIFLFMYFSLFCKNCFKFDYYFVFQSIVTVFSTIFTMFSTMCLNLIPILFILFQYNLLLYTFDLPNFYDTIYYPYQSSVSYFKQSYTNINLTYVPDDNFKASCYTLRPRITSVTRDPSGLQFITEYVKDDNNQYQGLQFMMDTGATICGINESLAKSRFSKQVKRLARPLHIDTIDQNVSCQYYIDFEIYNPSNNKIKTKARFYLMKGLSFDCLASTHFLAQLGWKLVQEHPPFEHPRQPDETFGTCNNWDDDDIHISFDTTKEDNIKYEKEYLNTLTPWQEYVYKCTHPQVAGTPLESMTGVFTGTKYVNLNNKRVHHISRYKVSKSEMRKAKKLCKDRKFDGVPLEHLKLRSQWLYDQMYQLCYHKYKDRFAKHQFDLGKVKNFEFKIDLKDESKDERIFVPQYHLDGDKRLVVIYNSLKNIKNGLYKPTDNTFHNVPILVVLKKDGRYRLAYDFRLLNKHTKDVKSHIPSYNWLFELLQGRGLFTVSDAKNFFEAIVTRASDRLYSTIHAPNGRFVLTRGTYGYKNIATYAQQVSDHLMLPLGRAGAFVDDMFIKHPENATDQELLEIAEKFLLRCRKLGILLHPEKTYFFVPEIEFLGYIFNQKGHRPHPKYLKRFLNIKRPKGVSQIRAFLGLVQYIARYVHRLAEWSHYLTILTRKDNTRTWGEEQQQAFETICDKISKIGLLYHPTDDGIFLVQTDASCHSVAGTLFQLQYDPEIGRKQWKLIEFFSKQLDQHLTKHHIGVKECLAISYALNHWKHFLLRDKFYLDTDHKNLIRLYDPNYDSASNMKKQQIYKTMQDATAMFHFELAHLEGKNLILADYLSRDGSELNSIDNIDKIKLNKTIQFANRAEASHYKMMYARMIDHRNQIFSDSNDDWKPIEEMDPILQHAYTLHETDFATVNKTVHNQFNIDHLNHEYIKNHGYVSKSITSDTVYESSEKLQLRNHKLKPRVNKYGPNGLKSILKTDHTYASTMSQSDKNLIDSLYNKQLRKFDSLLIKRLSISFQNTIINMLDVAPMNEHRIEFVNQLFNAYCLKYNESHVIPVYALNNDPNYNINSEYNRRGTRKRIPTQPFWKQNNKSNRKSISKNVSKIKSKNAIVKNKNKNSNNQSSLNRSNADLDDSKDDCKEDPIDDSSNRNVTIDNTHENECIIDDDYNYELLKDLHSLHFPFKTTVDVIDNLYDQLYQPDKYNDILSNDNFEFQQNEDSICSRIKDHIVNHDNTDYDYIKTHCPSLVHLVKNDRFILKDNLLYIKADKHHSHIRLFVPSALIHPLMKYEHCINHLGHPGVTSLARILNSKYYWPHLHADVQTFVQQCVPCQLGKGSKSYKRGKLEPLVARVHNDIVHMDFAGPFYGKFYILIIVDKFTGMTMLLPCYSTSAEVVVHSILYHWYTQHGLPRTICTDRGTGFIAEANQVFCKFLGIKKIFTSSYHPQTNSKAERVVQETKKALRMVNIELDDALTSKSFNKNPVNVEHCIKQITLLLPSIQFSINQKVHNMTLVSPHMMLYGKNLNDIVDLKLARELHDHLPHDFDKLSKYEIKRQLQYLIEQTHERYNHRYDKYVIIMKDNYDIDKHDDYFQVGDLVAYYIGDRSATNKKLRKRFTGPWVIVERLRHNTVKIVNLIDNKEIATHVSMLKRYYKKGFTPLVEIEKSERAKLLAQIKSTKSKN